MHLSNLLITHLALLGVVCGRKDDDPRRMRSGSHLRREQTNGIDLDAFGASLLGGYVNHRRTNDEAEAEIEAWERMLSGGSLSQPTKAPSPPTPTPPTPTPPTPTPPTPTPPTPTPPTPTPPTPTPPTPTPPTPTPSPTDCCGLPPGTRRQQLFDLFSDVSNPEDITATGTPQNLAFEWLVEDDEYCVCPNNPKAVQRYVMAVYYYSTDGDQWVNCGADSAVCLPNGTFNNGIETSGCYPGAEARWLSNVTECQWCGGLCEAANNTCITKIDVGKITKSLQGVSLLSLIVFIY